MYNKAITKDFDVVACDLFYVYDNKKVEAFSNINNDIFTKEEIKKCMINIYPSAWNKIYKKELFKYNIYFKDKVWFEDVEFLYRLISKVNSIGVVHENFYNYVQRDGAITKTFDDRLFHYIDNWNGILDFYKKNKIYEEYKLELEYCYVRYLYATFIKSASNFNNKKLYEEAVGRAIESVKNNFPNYRKNKYFYKSLKGIYLLTFNKLYSKILYKVGK